MDFWQVVILVIIPSGLIGALTGGLVNHLSNKKLDIHKRTMEIRKEVYTKVNELFSSFYSTATEEESNAGKVNLLKYYREIQMWGSDEVVRNFKNLLAAIDVKRGFSQEERNLCYKEFVLAMRRDLLEKTDLTPDELEIHGLIK